jgi:preprotein translocase subunit YajC
VVTAGGILGKVSAIGEGVVTLEVAKDVQIKVQKFQVSSLVPKGTLKG